MSEPQTLYAKCKYDREMSPLSHYMTAPNCIGCEMGLVPVSVDDLRAETWATIVDGAALQRGIDHLEYLRGLRLGVDSMAEVVAAVLGVPDE